MLFPNGFLTSLSLQRLHTRRIEPFALRLVRQIHHAAVGPHNPDETVVDFWAEVFVDLSGHVRFATDANVPEPGFANLLRLLAERLFQRPFKVMTQSEVDREAEENEHPRQQSRIPHSQSKTNGARVHEPSSPPIA